MESSSYKVKNNNRKGIKEYYIHALHFTLFMQLGLSSMPSWPYINGSSSFAYNHLTELSMMNVVGLFSSSVVFDYYWDASNCNLLNSCDQNKK